MNTQLSSTPGIFELAENQPAARPYRGGSGIARFRGIPHEDAHRPEDFLGSTTEVFGGGGVGLSMLTDGRTLRQAVAEDPVGFLGHTLSASHISGDSGLLTKLLSTDERLFIHAHPDDAFAQHHQLGTCGKTESWLILSVEEGTEAYVLLGFKRNVSSGELSNWFEHQDVAAMSEAMHRIPVSAGDTFHVPAGIPHGIGPGITLLELQQPTDLSILLEYSGYPGLNRESALLGMPRETALSAFRIDELSTAELSELRSVRPQFGREQQLFPASADSFYAAYRIRPGAEPVTLDPGYKILVVLDGTGQISGERDIVEAAAGTVFLVRHDAGPISIHPDLDVVSCQPAPFNAAS